MVSRGRGVGRRMGFKVPALPARKVVKKQG